MATILPEMYDEAVCAGQFNQDGGGQWGRDLFLPAPA